MTERIDTVVVGAGLSGRAAALALASKGFEVLLCDRAAPRAGEDPRTTALAYASVRALERLGVWAELEPDAAPVRDIAVATGRGPRPGRPARRGAALGFDDGLLGDTERWRGTPLAWIVPNAALSGALAAACARSDRIEERNCTVTAVAAGQGGAGVAFADGSAAEASFVAACDGRRSPLRRRAGLRTIERDFGQDAVTFTVSHARPHDDTARQVFLPGGPLAALPLRGDRSSIVWSMPRARAAALAAEPDSLPALVAANLPELGEVALVSAPVRFPLGFLFAPSIVADRLALVDEAGRAIHPLAGQGYNLALADACALADTVAEARAVGLDVGHGTVLARYDAWRRAPAAAMAFGTSVLARGLSTPERVTRAMAGAGFGLVGRSEGLRRAFAKRAGGEAGRLPSLMAAEA